RIKLFIVKVSFSSVKMIFCSVQDAVNLLTLFKYLFSSNVLLLSRTSIDGSIFYLYYLYCLSIFQRTCCFRFKSGCKGKGFIFNYQTFSEVFLFFLFTHFSGSLCERERMYKRKTKAVFFANRTAKIRTLFIILQNFLEVFLFFSLSAISLFHYVNSARLSSLGKRVQKYALLVYNPNILNYFFEVFLKESAKTLKDNDVVEHIFLS
ncbi:hypothetical protein, partial [Bacteroides xylanisolvens]|uniref:hypothetical protein n=1 Tax=Bacteroides xylanisolvens TaxID=371601 RepID=UPI001F002A0F